MNRFDIEILDDGRVKITSPGGFTNHKSAEEALAFLKELFNGEWETIKRKPSLLTPNQHNQQHHHHKH